MTVVWVGYDNPASLGDNETGAAVAGPIWHDYMAVALKDRPVLNFPQPPGVTMAPWDSGYGHGDRRVQAGPDARAPRSRSAGMGVASQSAPGSRRQPLLPGRAPGAGGGIDMSLGGLY